MAFVKVPWEFYDGTNTYVLLVNPSEGGTPSRERNIGEHSPTAPDPAVRAILFEGSQKARELTFKGTLLTQVEVEAFEEWFDKATQIRITDDLERPFWGVFSRITFTRARTVHYPWRHNYDATFKIVDWPEPAP